MKHNVIAGLSRYSLQVFWVTVACLLTACDPWADDIKLKNPQLDKTLWELLQETPEVSDLVTILKRTGQDTLLQNEPSLTLFAPENSVLTSVAGYDDAQLTEWLKNYIARSAYYTNAADEFDVAEIEMLNGKTVPVAGKSISGANLKKRNLSGINGVIHIIDNTIIERKNIWEYLQTQTDYTQVQLIQSFEEVVMDMDRSVQISVDANGRAVYDTVWTTINTFLNAIPLDNEKLQVTYILLDNAALTTLQAKYAKYFAQDDAVEQERQIQIETAVDLTLMHRQITEAGRFQSVRVDLLVDIDPANITKTYQASNGIVYHLSDADIKMYENKIKTQIIEAENFTGRWDTGNTWWSTRYRGWASGGQDVMFRGFTRNTYEWDVYDEVGDSLIHKSRTDTYRAPYESGNPGTRPNNVYLKYNPVLYSTSYNIFWVAHNDFESHYTFPDTVGAQQPMILEQKLFISFPGRPALSRGAGDDAKISNNFSADTVFVGTSIAGPEPTEVQLSRYTVTAASTATAADGADKGLYILDKSAPDASGDSTTVVCPAFGTATFFVANTPREKAPNTGLMFLDYIKIVPTVDPND